MILVASPLASVRSRWRRSLPAGATVHEAAERGGLERALQTLRPLVALVDLTLPGLAGVDGLAEAARLGSATRVIAMTAAPSESEGLAALTAGARGYCPRDVDAPLLRKAVEVVGRGEIWAGRTLTAQLLDVLTAGVDDRRRTASARAAARLERLTPRESEIAVLLGAGASNKEIASKLGVTERTVKAHLTAMFRKLGVGDRLRLALLVNDHEAGPPARPALHKGPIDGRPPNP